VTRNARFQYPLLLDLHKKPVVVVGGGKVAERKVFALLRAGALVCVVSPVLTPKLEQCLEDREVTLVPRAYRQGDLASACLAFAATNRPEVNKAVAEEGRRTGIWVNVADQSAPGEFIVPASFFEKGLIISVSSQGENPALAVKVRNRIQHFLSDKLPD